MNPLLPDFLSYWSRSLAPLLPSNSASILARSRLSSSVVAFSICGLVSILASLLSCVLYGHIIQECGTQDKSK
jgi:hypothetical protein